MTMAEAAKRLGISRQRVYQKLVEGRRIDYVKGDICYSQFYSKDGQLVGALIDGKWVITRVGRWQVGY